MQYLGDFVAGSTIRGSFNTRTAAGTPITLGGTPALSVYKDGGTTETTTGVTLTVDFDSRTGHHLFAIVTSDAFYSTGSDFRIVITTGTVDGTSVVGTEVGSFSIQNRSVVPVASQVAAIETDTQDIQSRLPAALVSGRMDSSVGAMAANTLTASALATDAVAEIQNGLSTSAVTDAIKAKTDSLTFTVAGFVDCNLYRWRGTQPGTLDSNSFVPANVAAINGNTTRANTFATDLDNNTVADIETATTNIQSRLPATLVGGRMDASVGAMAANTLTASALATDAVTEIQTGLSTSIVTDAIKAKTDNLPTDPADQSAVEAAITAATSPLALQTTLLAGVGYIDTEVAAIKATTDKLDTTVELDGLVYRFTANALETAPTGGGGGGTGTGARTVTITVTDGTDPVEGAAVRLSRVGETYVGTTDVSGEIVFSVDDATWTVSITASGLTFVPVTLVVDGNETVTYAMADGGGIVPQPARQVTGYWVVYDSSGNVAPGLTVHLSIVRIPGVTLGVAADDATRTAVADSAGIVYFTGLFPGAVYSVGLGTSTSRTQVTVPSTADGTVALGSIVG